MNSKSRPALLLVAEGTLEANLYKSLLEAQGIPVMLVQESATSAIGLYVGPMAAVEVFVPDERLEEARGLIDEMRDGQEDASEA